MKSFDGELIWYRNLGIGQGTPLVLCDGLGCAGFIWKYFIRHFSRDHEIVHMNYRGHGRSPNPECPENLGIDVNAKDLNAVLKDSRIRKKVVLVGHSLGVQVAFEFYRRFPQKVKGIIAINGSYGKLLHHVHNTDYLLRALPLLKFLAEKFPGAAQEFWKRVLKSPLPFSYAKIFEVNPFLASREDFKPYFSDLANIDPSLFINTLAAIADHCYEDRLEHIKVPTLIVSSEKDKFTPAHLSEHMHVKINQSEILHVPTGSHVAPIEIPELVNLRVEKFLSQMESRRFDQRKAPRSHPRRKAAQPQISQSR